MDAIFWVGSREDDIKDDPFFHGSVTRYGNDNSCNVSYCNSNEKTYIDYIKNSLESISSEYDTCKFYFANGLTAHKMNDTILKKAICIPSYSTVESLNDKLFMRNYLSNTIDALPYIVVNKTCLQDYQFVSAVFGHKYSKFMVQSPTIDYFARRAPSVFN